MISDAENKILNEHEAAEFLHMSVTTLQQWRHLSKPTVLQHSSQADKTLFRVNPLPSDHKSRHERQSIERSHALR